jgi:hypothetical protein
MNEIGFSVGFVSYSQQNSLSLQPTMGTRASSPATIAGEDARAPMQTAVITVSNIEEAKTA